MHTCTSTGPSHSTTHTSHTLHTHFTHTSHIVILTPFSPIRLLVAHCLLQLNSWPLHSTATLPLQTWVRLHALLDLMMYNQCIATNYWICSYSWHARLSTIVIDIVLNPSPSSISSPGDSGGDWWHVLHWYSSRQQLYPSTLWAGEGGG